MPDKSVTAPLVTVITPSFNQAAYIGATIDSVLGQDYAHLEYLVIDGGSTDGTVELLKSVQDPRLQWVSEPDRGQSHAINKGLARAHGDILAYLNSDDLFLPGAISFNVDHFQNSECDLIYGDCLYIDADGTKTGMTYGEPFDLQTVLAGRVFLPQQTAFWRKRVTESVGLFDETLHYTMDVDYWLRLAVAGFKLCYVSGERGAYRLHGDSKTVSQVSGFWADWDRMIDQFFALPQASALAQLRSRQNYLWMYTLYAPWIQGYRAELRPLLLRIITGAAPSRHRALAGMMLMDSYFHTSLSTTALNLFRKAKASEKSNR